MKRLRWLIITIVLLMACSGCFWGGYGGEGYPDGGYYDNRGGGGFEGGERRGSEGGGEGGERGGGHEGGEGGEGGERR